MISIIDDKNLLDFDMVYQFTTTYSFSKGISREKFNMAVHNSWCFGIMVYNKQVGFARLITDYATFAFLKDLFIILPASIYAWLFCFRFIYITMRVYIITFI